MSTHHGHPSWRYWNVALWLGNDEGLYRAAFDHMTRHRDIRIAARAFVKDLASIGITETPDGAQYSQRAVAHAMRGLRGS